MRWIWRRIPACRRACAAPRARGRDSSASAPSTSARAARPAPAPRARRCDAASMRVKASSGAPCWGPSESAMASSLAAACSSKSKLRQMRLRSASPSARFTRPPNGRVDHELHAAGVVEEALDDDALARRQRAERLARRREVAHHLQGPAGVEAGLGREPGRQRLGLALREARLDVRAQLRDLGRELLGARGRLAQPERDVRRTALGVAHAHHAGLDAADLPGGGAEQEDVAGHALDRPSPRSPCRRRCRRDRRPRGNRRCRGSRRPRSAPRAARRGARAARRSRDRGGATRRADRARSRCPRPASRRRTRSLRAVALRRARRGARAPADPPRATPRPRRRPRSAAPGCRAARAGGSTRSRRPARTARHSAAHSTSSSRVVGKSRPLGVARRACPERPTRWSKVAMLRGEPI